MIWRPDRKPTYTPSAKYFNMAKPIAERLVLNPVGNRRPPGGRRMLRLSFGALTPKEDRSIPELHRLIARGPLNAKFLFPDTGFITTAMYPEFWTLGAGRYVAFPEITVAELSGWFNNPFHNSFLHSWLPRAAKLCQALPTSSPRLFRTAEVLGTVGHRLVPFTVAVANKDSFRTHGYDYYVNLLSLRKRQGVLAYRELKAKLGREPAEPELKQHLQKNYGPIAAPIAFKGWQDHGKRNYLADEELVVTAVFTAIATGQETLILTRDTDVFEQFTQLLHLLSGDYACFRYAEVHHQNPDGCPMYPMAIPKGRGESSGFEGNEIHQIVLSEKEMDRMWPGSYTPVHTYCVLLGNTHLEPKISVAAFCLETEMAWMLEVKGKTGGKNTEHFLGKNMIAGTSVDGNRIGVLFVLGAEKQVKYEGVNVSWIDLHHALKSNPLIIRKFYIA